jgi:beta-carotene ketolase (CrtW type)
VIALTIIWLWANSLSFLIFNTLNYEHPSHILLAILWQTFLYTGLFVTGHEAMHEAICPNSPRVNHLIGSIAVLLYAFFSYEQLLKKHWLHHRYPSSPLDPDFHNGMNIAFWPWYFHFMKGYWNWNRTGIFWFALCLLSYALKIHPYNMLLFIVIPSFLSSLQLFYFGTFLPHRELENDHKPLAKVKTTNLPCILSFITCYHFGYHQEHHENPDLPWWELPTAYRRKNSQS